MGTDWIFVGQIILFCLLLVLSAFFSSSEVALFSLSDAQRERLIKQNHPSSSIIERLLSKPSQLITAILVGNEFVNVSASVLSAAMIIAIYGADSKYLNMLIMVPILLIFGEISPKSLAIHFNLQFATKEAPIIAVFATYIRHVIKVIGFISNGLIRAVLGDKPSRSNIFTAKMMRSIAKEAVDEGVMKDTEAQYINQIFDFRGKKVGDLMTVNSDIFSLTDDLSFNQIVKQIHLNKHSKIPVYNQNDHDEVLGILVASDLLKIDAEDFSHQYLLKRLKKPLFIPSSKPAADLLQKFIHSKLAIAIVVDEFGGVNGLITMEDMLECIFGDIRGRSDDIYEPTFLRNGKIMIAGGFPISQLNKILDTKLAGKKIGNNIASLLLNIYGELPPQKANIEIKGVNFYIKKISKQRIEEVVVSKKRVKLQTTEMLAKIKGLKPKSDLVNTKKDAANKRLLNQNNLTQKTKATKTPKTLTKNHAKSTNNGIIKRTSISSTKKNNVVKKSKTDLSGKNKNTQNLDEKNSQTSKRVTNDG